MPSATVDGHELHYVERGEGEPLLLIMGLSGTHLSWGDPFLDELARDFRAIAYDNRGVGRSGRVDRQFTIVELASDAAGLLDELGLESAHVMGISMGGMIAQELAIRHPERVRTLVIGCSYPGGEGSALTPVENFSRLAHAWDSGDQERILRTGWEINVSPAFAGRPGAYEAWREMALAERAPLAVTRMQAQACVLHDASARLEEISAPTLVVHGTADGMLPSSNSRLIAERIPGARLVELEGVGHLFWWEQPERSAELVREHVRAAAATG
ncbi:MAG TPA: alpha/beta fold hydrolase [Solirubrobacteraceae bacterium]|jgi:pimeloyl-ACP methyl ester carboxylesterase|nr:alpha/beta fold hydrolase [Solirubrobacteraceae bacterium]